MPATILSVHSHPVHAFSKTPRSSIELIEGQGVQGDAHCGVTVKHRSRVAKDPGQPNLRQIHLLPSELFAEVGVQGFGVRPGDMGENVTTCSVDLLGLSEGTWLALGESAIVEVTGLRNPCSQIERFRAGLLAAVLDRTPAGLLVRKAGVMGIVVAGGTVRPGDAIGIARQPATFKALQPV